MLLTVVETSLFVRQAEAVWDEVEREEFIDFIASHPENGDIIPDTGGLRKLRWRRAGTGKRGGVRIVYFFHHESRPLYLLMVYAKARQENLKPNEKRALRELVETIKAEK